MLRRLALDNSIVELGLSLLDSPDLKAVMLSKTEDGDVQITLVEGREDSHKVKLGRIHRATREFVREGAPTS